MSESSAKEFSFVAAEHEVLAFWLRERIFERSVSQNAGNPPYIFYDGPPFATGLPHHGHLVGSTIKDIVPRYWTMKGRYVERRFGWDCHGLPIEHEIDKQFGASSADVVQQLGVAGYNDACRSIVGRYVTEWRSTITRLGRWVDFDNGYKTMDPWFMESVWWVLKQLWDKGLVFQDYKVVPFSTALGTVLSNFEASSNYQEVQDPAVTVLFKLLDEDAYVAAWTTTPWTLPSNLALCVGEGIDYVRVLDEETGQHIYLAAARVEAYAKRHRLQVLSTLTGAQLRGRRYAPLLPYFADAASAGAFVILSDDYVSTDAGTGIVHQAPAFGADDFRIWKAHGIDAFANPVDNAGRFTSEVPDFAGEHVKEADKAIIRMLKERGALYEQDVIVHNYPFCWRSDTPLIYKAIPSWYVRVADHRERLLAANAQIRWVPEHIKDGRFGNWLGGALDWSISRNRVWGTPLPIWINDVTGASVCVGSIAELAALTGVQVTDLHREFVDPLTFSRPGEAGVYRRIEEVLDCWFESGSMPYAQLHYPFENKDVFDAGFPAEFIAEGLDQTRGWFYTLTVLAAHLFDKPAFKNVIVNGMVNAEDGKKMSKRLRNYTAPDDLMERYGADALRLYYITSGLTRGEEIRFSDNGVRDMARRALLPWYNAFRFLATYAAIDRWSPDGSPDGSPDSAAEGAAASSGQAGDNILDRWILSRLQSLKQRIEVEMSEYRLYTVVPALFDFIEDLTNWYIRLNRPRFWGEAMDADKLAAYRTLYTALSELGKVMAPFTPFIAEHIYREFAELMPDRANAHPSVHLCDYPVADAQLIQPRLEEAVTRMQQAILLGRQMREQKGINLRMPLASLTVYHDDAAMLADLRAVAGYLQDELNVEAVRYGSDASAVVTMNARANFRVLGKRLGKRMPEFKAAIEALDPSALRTLSDTGEVEVLGERFTTQEIEVEKVARAGSEVATNGDITVELDTRLDERLQRKGLAREFVNRIQRARKDLDFNVADRIAVEYRVAPRLAEAIADHAAYIAGEVLAVSLSAGQAEGGVAADIDDEPVLFTLKRITAQ